MVLFSPDIDGLIFNLTQTFSFNISGPFGNRNEFRLHYWVEADDDDNENRVADPSKYHNTSATNDTESPPSSRRIFDDSMDNEPSLCPSICLERII